MRLLGTVARTTRFTSEVAIAMAMGAVLAVTIVVALVAAGLEGRAQTLSSQAERAELLARLLENQAANTFESARVAMASLAEVLATSTDAVDRPDAMTPLLEHAQSGLPVLRSLAVVDPSGRVLASTNREEVGLLVDGRRLARNASTRDSIGPPSAGRGLASLSLQGRQPAAPSGLGFVPMSQPVRLRDGRSVHLVALLNPDVIANQQQAALESELAGSLAVLATYQGELITGPRTLDLPVGADITRHIVWQSGLRRRDHASLQGAGFGGERQIIAFRASRGMPLVVVIEHGRGAALARWWQGFRWVVAFGFAGIAFIAGMTWVALRSLRARASARQQLESQLRFTAMLTDITPLPIATTDHQGKLVTVNQAWENLVGEPRHLVTGRPLGDFMPREQTAGDGGPGLDAHREIRMRHADGSMRDIVVSEARLAGDRSAEGALFVLTDVSEYRAAERATREARDAAEEASRAKSEFIANISHEMRTPLQAIIGFSELGVVRGASQPALAGMFGSIHAAGERMLSVVDDLLDVAKIESTVGTLHLERTDLRIVVRAVVRELQPLLDRKRLRLVVELGSTALVAKVDPMRIHQVFRNVLANAIKFSPEGAAIEIGGAMAGDGTLGFEISDHGPGIPPAELQAIFEAFVQSSQTQDGSGGTGLGLAICRKIIEIHGGRIWARNAEVGAVFHIELASARSPAETIPAPLEACT